PTPQPCVRSKGLKPPPPMSDDPTSNCALPRPEMGWPMNEKPRPPPPISTRCEENSSPSIKSGAIFVCPVTHPKPDTPESVAGFAHTPGSPQVTAELAPPMAAARIDVSI